jgi:hypothetical protein
LAQAFREFSPWPRGSVEAGVLVVGACDRVKWLTGDQEGERVRERGLGQHTAPFNWVPSPQPDKS